MSVTTTPGLIGTIERLRLMNLGQLSKQDCTCNNTAEVDAGLCPMPPICFPRFFPGQLVQPDDLQGIEQLFFDHQQLRGRYLVGWGIACGFRVGIDGTVETPDPRQGRGTAGILLRGAKLRVESGYGIDHYGRDVRMVDDTSILIENLLADREARIKAAMSDPWCTIPGCQPQPVTHYCVAVRYKECLDKPVPSYAKQCGPPKTICDYSRVCESVEIRLFGKGELPSDTPLRSLDQQSWCDKAAAANAGGRVPVESKAELAMEATGFDKVVQNIDAGTTTKAMIAETSTKTPGCVKALNALTQPCAPCVDNPWLTLACFDVQDGIISNLDCSVRRTIWSMAELQDALTMLLCYILRLTGGK